MLRHRQDEGALIAYAARLTASRAVAEIEVPEGLLGDHLCSLLKMSFLARTKPGSLDFHEEIRDRLIEISFATCDTYACASFPGSLPDRSRRAGAAGERQRAAAADAHAVRARR